jgi:hypothetical protein
MIIQHQHNQLNLLFSYFYPSFLFFSFLLPIDLLAVATTFWVVVDVVPPLIRRHLVRRRTSSLELIVPQTTVGTDKIRLSDLPCFKQKLLALVYFVCKQYVYILFLSLRGVLISLSKVTFTNFQCLRARGRAGDKNETQPQFPRKKNLPY